eukprot:5997844-Prymnesium_polylepis.1
MMIACSSLSVVYLTLLDVLHVQVVAERYEHARFCSVVTSVYQRCADDTLPVRHFDRFQGTSVQGELMNGTPRTKAQG